jgi:hypothetical protein
MATYIQIATTTVGAGGSATIDFTSIPSTYTDLLIKTSFRSTTTNVWVQLAFNGLTTNMTARLLQGDGSAASSASYSSALYNVLTNSSGSTASIFGSADLYIPSYAGSTNKSYSIETVDESTTSSANMALQARLWTNTAAINQITLTAQSGLLAQHSTATLYGIKNS